HPLLYTTSKSFMDYFGINSTDDLPKIKEILSEQLVEGTIINTDDFTSNTIIDEVETNLPNTENSNNSISENSNTEQ
ncbi:MAG TPA: hypothetical protein PKG56_05420, partial [Chitinophagaceae bacterium]|nr:hypothetical protein [Chitinophagaceae bacterium]